MINHILGTVLAVMSRIKPIETKATYYAPHYEGHLMANGKPYHKDGFTVAFNRFPLGTLIKIMNPANGRFMFATVTDRKIGPGIDLSERLYKELGFTIHQGYGKVTIMKAKG